MILTKRSTETRANGIAVEASPPMNIRDNRTILLVEDSPEEAELFCEALRIAWDSVASPEYFPRPTVTVRHHAADALEFLRAQAAAHPPKKVTYERYLNVWQDNHDIIAKQDVDVTTSTTVLLAAEVGLSEASYAVQTSQAAVDYARGRSYQEY